MMVLREIKEVRRSLVWSSLDPVVDSPKITLPSLPPSFQDETRSYISGQPSRHGDLTGDILIRIENI